MAKQHEILGKYPEKYQHALRLEKRYPYKIFVFLEGVHNPVNIWMRHGGPEWTIAVSQEDPDHLEIEDAYLRSYNIAPSRLRLVLQPRNNPNIVPFVIRDIRPIDARNVVAMVAASEFKETVEIQLEVFENGEWIKWVSMVGKDLAESCVSFDAYTKHERYMLFGRNCLDPYDVRHKLSQYAAYLEDNQNIS